MFPASQQRLSWKALDGQSSRDDNGRLLANIYIDMFAQYTSGTSTNSTHTLRGLFEMRGLSQVPLLLSIKIVLQNSLYDEYFIYIISTQRTRSAKPIAHQTIN